MSHRAPDPRSSLVFDVRELGRRAGLSKSVHRVAEAPQGLGIEVIGVPPGSPIDLDLLFESVVEGVLVTGDAGVHLRGECSRCLEDVEFTDVIEVQELFLYPGKEPDDTEAGRVEDELIDLEPLLRDAVVLDLPFTPLCRDDCAGLCADCGANLNNDPDHTHVDETDPRWSGLADWDRE